MQRTRRRTTAVLAGLIAGAVVGAGAIPPPAAASGTGWAIVHAPASPRAWDPLTDEKWELDRGQVVLTEPGTNPGGPRRPFEYAIVTKGPELASLALTAEVRIDEAVSVDNRDVVLIWNYQSPTRFYYAHLSQDNTIYPHNGIFVVDDADRRRIDDQWNGVDEGAPPAIDDTDWHDVTVTYHAGTGRIAVFVDHARTPLMTATDTTFAGGRVGFGSFDNFGRARHVWAAGTVAGR